MFLSNNFIRYKDNASRGFISFSTVSHGVDIFENKKVYIKHKWDADFPSHSMLTYDEISKLASRSRDVGNWFSRVTDEFILYKEAPDWFLAGGKEASDWTSEIQDKYKLLKIMNKEYAEGMNLISMKSRKEMDVLNENHKQKIINTLEKTPELVFELMNTQMLPLETHIKVFEFDDKDEASKYLSDSLAQFKINKFKEFQSGELTSTELINLLFEK